MRRLRPLRLILDMQDVFDLDAINVGTLAAACHLGDDHQVAVFLDNSSLTVAERLTAAGVGRHRLREGLFAETRPGMPAVNAEPGQRRPTADRATETPDLWSRTGDNHETATPE